MSRSVLPSLAWVWVVAGAGAPVQGLEGPATDAQALIDAAARGDLSAVNAALGSGVDVDATTSDVTKSTALHAAAERSQVAVLKRLIEAGANVNIGNYLAVTPLHWAAVRGPAEAVEALIAAKADVNAWCVQFHTPLGAAARAGNLDTARGLIEGGADVNGGKTMTPLALASKRGSVEMISLLIEKGAKVNHGARPALHWAGEAEVAKALIRAGADVDVRDSEGRTPLHLTTGHWIPKVEAVRVLIAAGADVNARSPTDVTPLHSALRNRELDTAKVLTEAGADINAADAKGHTPLSLAREAGEPYVEAVLAAGATDDGRTDLLRAVAAGDQVQVRALIDADADVNETGPGGVTPVQVASRLGHSEVLDALIRAGAAVDVCDEDEKTPLHVAASGAIAERLIAAGAKVHAGDECRAPILEAVEEDRVDVVRVLIKHGVAERSDGQGMLLAWAAFYGRIEVVKVLLEAEIRPSAPVPFGGETALHVVAGGSLADMSCPEHVTPHDRFEIARILIAAGAEVNAAANRGYFRGSTPLHAAARRGHAAMVALLLEHGADVGAAPADGHFAGYTALHGAAKGGHREVIMRLLAASADVNATTGEEYHGGICTPLDLAKTPEVRDLLVERGGKSARELGAAD